MKRFVFLTVVAMLLAACGSDSPDAGDGAGVDVGDSSAAADSDGDSGDEGSTTEPSDSTGTAVSDPLSVVVTTTVWGDVVSNVTGDAANVEVLFPVGADPHDHQLSAAQVASMQEADLVVVNGLALEEGILDVVESLEGDGANVLEIADMLDPIPFGEAGHSDGDDPDSQSDEDGEDRDDEGDHSDEEAHEHGDEDPHVWLDPLRVAAGAELIAEELAALDPAGPWVANAAAFADELRTLDSEIVTMFEAISEERRAIITNHEALGYFADRYGFEVLGVVIPGGSTLADPSSAELAELVSLIEAAGVEAIFAETVEPSTLAEAIAAEVGGGVEVVELFTGSLGGPGSGGESYVEMLRTNAERIAGALG